MSRLKNNIMRSALCVVVSLAIVVSTIAPVSALGGGHKPTVPGICVDFKLPVSPAPGQPKSWKIASTYCQPWHWGQGKRQIDVLTHGATYKSTYWDWPQNPNLYSYVKKTLGAG